MLVPVRVYKNSVLASILSICGTVCLACALGMFVSGEIIGGIATVVVFAGLWFLASKVSASKESKKNIKKQQQMLNDPYLGYKVQSSCMYALEYVRTFPNEQAIQLVASVNPYAAQQIRMLIANQISLEEITQNFKFIDEMNAKK